MIHPRIEQLIAEAKANGFEKVSLDLLVFLSSINASQTEASIVAHQGFGLTIDEADNLVLSNINLFPPCTVGDVFYECAVYLWYAPDDPNYRVGENSIRIPLNSKRQQ